jgi:uncharacterized protein (DUF4415 family)
MRDASSQRGVRKRTKGVAIGKPSKARKARATNWGRLRSMGDAEIHKGIAADSDARATDEAFWKDANVVWPTRKQVVTMRLDSDLLRWFRQQRGYQTRINAILRAYMAAHASERSLQSITTAHKD